MIRPGRCYDLGTMAAKIRYGLSFAKVNLQGKALPINRKAIVMGLATASLMAKGLKTDLGHTLVVEEATKASRAMGSNVDRLLKQAAAGKWNKGTQEKLRKGLERSFAAVERLEKSLRGMCTNGPLKRKK